MNGQPDSTDASLPVDVLMRIDRVCLDFEAAWKADRAPRIEDYLGEAQDLERDRLLRELLLLELDYRGCGDEQPTPDEYRERFPQDSGLVSDVFEKLSAEDADAHTDPHGPAGDAPRYTLPAEFGDYELLEMLGEGGMGVVYRARQKSADRIVALKLIRTDRLEAVFPDRRREAIERFWTEAHAAAKLEHDHIVTVYHVGQVDGQPYISMRYVEGQSLDQALEDGPLDGRKAAALLEPVARAVHYAHQHDIVHRDVKPSNILLDVYDRPYVIDFGLARSLQAAREEPLPGNASGTAAYMAPEQASRQRAGPASDSSGT